MKTIANHIILLLAIISIFLGCKKDEAEPRSIPVVETSYITDVTCFTANCWGEVIDNGGGRILETGICWGQNNPPTISDYAVSFSNFSVKFMTGIFLRPNTTFYVRSFASNQAGIGYGETKIINTPEAYLQFNPDLKYGMLSDINGNQYKTIEIGNQVWMAENLRAQHLNDGTPITKFDPEYNSYWQNIQMPGYCEMFSVTSSYVEILGRYYNFYAVESNNLCPDGWKVPEDDDWNILFQYLGGDSVAALKLKEAGTRHWNQMNDQATNESGFTAISGSRATPSGLISFGKYGYWWSSTTAIRGGLKYNIYHNSDQVFRYDVEKSYFFSVRCVKKDSLLVKNE